MRIEGIIWLQSVIDKIIRKHRVDPVEVEETLGNRPIFRFTQKGERKGEDVYLALGESDAGRHLAVLFIHKLTKDALILSARDMAKKERRYYEKRKR